MARGKTFFNLGKYTFASWMRRGIGNAIAANGSTVIRAQIPINIQLNEEVLTQDVELLGPTDVMGIQSNAIVRTEPLNGTVDFEWNMLPYIEFYDEDFAWRYTPDAPDAKNNLRPWVALVVLKEEEFSDLRSNRGALSAIRINTAALPVSAETHLWAHMHTGEQSGVSDLDKILIDIANNYPKDPDGFTCRLLSPRRLDKKTRYHAFLVPAFEAGRLAGLGEKFATVLARKAAWSDTNRPGTLDFPVYHRWSFATSDASFEDLLAKIKPLPSHPSVGMRDLDTSRAGYVKANGTPNVGATTPSVLGLEGALRTPNMVSTAYVANGKKDDFQKDVAALLNLYDNGLPNDTPQYGEAKMDGDPILTIPLYGQPYVKRPINQLSTASGQNTPILRDGINWYSAVNFDPRNRVAAGLGTLVVQQNQESFMQSAWSQLQYLQKARNQLAAVGSIMERIKVRFTNETLVPQEDFVSMARNMTSRVAIAPKVTIMQNLTASILPNALMNSATRRIMRTNGRVVKRLTVTNATTNTLKVVTDKLMVNNGAALTSYRIKFLKDFVIMSGGVIVIGPQPIQTPFDIALGQYLSRIPSLPAQNVVTFKFADAHNNLISAITNAPQAVLKTKINLPATQTSVNTKPPSEFLGQPVFENSMYEYLWKMDKEWLLPNLHLIENNTVTLLENNIHFIHAYMLGVNQEMAHEMLWRLYPADLSATFFRHFWQAADNGIFDIETIKKWIGLPAPERKPATFDKAQLVLTLRGELLQKFPNTVIFAALVKRDASGKLTFNTEGSNPGTSGGFRFPIFRAELPTDLQFLGFDLTVKDVSTESPNGTWYFVIMEPVGEPRFGLDATFQPTNAAVYSRNDLSWEHLKNPNFPEFITESQKPTLATMPASEKDLWGKNAASMGALLFQQPFAHFIKATDMLTVQK